MKSILQNLQSLLITFETNPENSYNDFRNLLNELLPNFSKENYIYQFIDVSINYLLYIEKYNIDFDANIIDYMLDMIDFLNTSDKNILQNNNNLNFFLEWKNYLINLINKSDNLTANNNKTLNNPKIDFPNNSDNSISKKHNNDNNDLDKETKELINQFLSEVQDNLKNFSNIIKSLENNILDLSLYKNLYGVMHSIKGASNVMSIVLPNPGLTAKVNHISSIFHLFESVVSDILKETMNPDKEFIQLLFYTNHIINTIISDFFHSEFNNEEYNDIINRLELYELKSKTEKKQTKDKFTKTMEISQQVETRNEVHKIEKSFKIYENEMRTFKSISDRLNDNIKNIDKTNLTGNLDFNLFKNDIIKLNNLVLDVMYTPVKPLFEKYKKYITGLAEQVSKKINFIYHDNNLYIQRCIIDILDDILGHLLRNSLDHGIETKSNRLNKGKSENGNIKLISEYNEFLTIKVTDDGNGINKNKIIEKALNENIFSENELLQKSNEEIFNLIFEPAFSTKKDSNLTSGRGIGMTIVNQKIHNIGGNISICSSDNIGTEFIITLPNSLAWINNYET